MTLRLATEADLEALRARIKGVKVHQYPDYPSPEPDLGPARPIRQAIARTRKARVARPDYARRLMVQCKAVGLSTPILEHRFHDTRRWRFDLAWVDLKIAVEIEGGIWTRGRHTRGAGFEQDMSKYNEAVRLGWRVYRFAPKGVKTGKALHYMQKVLHLTRRPSNGKTKEAQVREVFRTGR